MKEKVLLLNAPSDNRYFTSVQPPLGILYIASFLRERGIAVSVLDLNIHNKWKKTLALSIREYKPSIIGISVNFSNRCQSYEISSIAKKIDKDITVVVGGPHPTISPLDFAISDIDYIIPFEAEKAMLNFIRAKNRDEAKGVLSCKSRNLTNMFDRINKDFIDNLDDLPFPAYDTIDIKDYYINSYKKRPIVSMITSRGCPQQCIFCSQSVSGRRWRARTPDNIVEEIIWLKERIGAREISIEDDNFTLDMGRVYRICEIMRSKEVKIIWQLANGIRADKVTKDLLKVMKDAGCWKVAIAPEVGSSESLEKIKKGIALEQFVKVAQWCRELGIIYYGFFLMGFPFQDKEDMEQTINFAIKLDPLLMDLSKVIPFPGTKLFAEFSDKDRERYKNNISYYYHSDDVLLDKMYIKAYFKFYIRPYKIFKIIKKIGIKQFILLLRYVLCLFLKECCIKNTT